LPAKDSVFGGKLAFRNRRRGSTDDDNSVDLLTGFAGSINARNIFSRVLQEEPLHCV
jgi:hypothetical protein